MTYARHSWPFSSEGSLACHLLWHGASVYIGHLRGPATLRPDSRTFGSGAVTTCFYDLSLSQVGFEHQYKQNNNAHWFEVLLKRLQKNEALYNYRCGTKNDLSLLQVRECWTFLQPWARFTRAMPTIKQTK